MRVLVTGGAGFVGEAVCRELERAECHPISVDREDFDLAHPGEAERMIEQTRPGYIFHLAARYGRILCREQPHRSVSDNAAATAELAAVAASKSLGVLYASSSEVYGDHGTALISESAGLHRPTTIYGLTKRWGEEVLRQYLRPEQLTIARLNMLYGPRQRAGHGCCALATFIRQAMEGEPLQVHREASRSWLYIDDAAAALVALMGRGGVWNVGNTAQERLLMTQLAELVLQEVGQGTMEIVPAPEDQIKHKHYDTSKLAKTGWRPRVPLAEGLARTVEWAKEEGMRDYSGVAQLS